MNANCRFRWPNRKEERGHFKSGCVAARLATVCGAANEGCLGGGAGVTSAEATDAALASSPVSEETAI